MDDLWIIGEDLTDRFTFTYDAEFTAAAAAFAADPVVAARAAEIAVSLPLGSLPSPRASSIAIHGRQVAIRWGFIDFATALCWDQPADVPRPAFGSISLHTSAITRDGRLLARRSQQVTGQRGLWSSSAGEGAEPDDFGCDGRLDVTGAAIRGLHEELAIARSDVQSVRLAAVRISDGATGRKALFHLEADVTGLSFAEVHANASNAHDAWEHDLLALEHDVARIPSAGFVDGFWPPVDDCF